MSSLKMLCVVRRRAGLTRREFFDYHFQKHGAISEAPTAEETPLVYYQTHFFDAAYPQANTGPNSNYPWAFMDDMTELYFSSPDHMRSVFTSEHVKTIVGPDGAKFNDFAAANAMLAGDDQTIFDNADADADNVKDGGSDAALVANYFVEAKNMPQAGAEFLGTVKPILLDCIAKLDDGSNQITKIVVTTRIPDPAQILKYFGGDIPSPDYSVVFTIYIKSRCGISTVRKVQALFEDRASDHLKSESAFITFGKRALLFDQTRGVRFDPVRQPVFEEF